VFEIQQENAIYIAVFYTGLSLIIGLALRFTAPKEIIAVSSRVNIKQCMFLMLGLFVFTLFVLISGGFLAHQDTAWQQMVQSSENIIPASIIIYVIFYPAFLILGSSIWLYARTRLAEDTFDKRFKLALIMNTLAPFMFLPTQDPDLLTLSADWWNILFRLIYWLFMLLWVSSLGYLVFRLGLKVSTLIKPMGK
jgi:heme/copper-type cytochrome/quinol oxidase subunit 2|tara:strand:- start:2377 stop:2958 length:582 start_codon:yes stop_codon:yes gene_type:complete